MGAQPQEAATAEQNSTESDPRAEGITTDSGGQAGETEAKTAGAKSDAETPGGKPADASAGPSAQTAEQAEGKADRKAGASGGRPDRPAFVVAAAALAACAGIVLYGVLSEDDEAKPKAVPSAEVTYEVTGSGTVDIAYRALGTSGDSDKAATATGVRLPWKKNVEVPLDRDPIISITLGEQGGQARCSLAIRGRHTQSATATGTFGRATCSGSLAAQGGPGR